MRITWELHRGPLRARLAEMRPAEVGHLDLDATLTAVAAEFERKLTLSFPGAAIHVLGCHSNHDLEVEFAADLYHLGGVPAEEKRVVSAVMARLLDEVIASFHPPLSTSG